MPEWFYGVLIALIAASGAWLTYLTNRRSADTQRLTNLDGKIKDLEDANTKTNKRFIRVVNYANRLRKQVGELGGDPEEWPDDLYDE